MQWITHSTHDSNGDDDNDDVYGLRTSYSRAEHIKRCQILHTRIYPGLYLIQTATSSSQQNNYSNNSDVIKIIMNLLKTDLDDDVVDGVKKNENETTKIAVWFHFRDAI